MIHSDIFLEIGSQHAVCEDYIIHGYDPFQYIILADGCSSSNNTEMGARILCHLAKQFLRYYQGEMPIDAIRMGQWIIHNAEMTARQLGLTINCLDATLIISYYYEDQRAFHTVMYGDGFVVSVHKEKIILQEVYYSNNAPYYLSYQIDDGRRELYEDLFPDKKLVRTELLGTNIQHHKEGLYPFKAHEVYTHIEDEFECLLIASDGLGSFLDGSETVQKQMPSISIASKLTQFKNTKGEFLKRRAKKQMKEFRGNNISHFDDLSVGVFLKE